MATAARERTPNAEDEAREKRLDSGRPWQGEKPMNDRTAMVVTVVGSSVGIAAPLLTVMTLLIGSVNTRIDDLQSTVNTRINDLQNRVNGRIDDTNSRIDDLNDRVTGVEESMRELRNLLIEALKPDAAANEH